MPLCHTSQNLSNEVDVAGKFLDGVEVGNCPNRHVLVRVHLRHQVGVVSEVLPGEVVLQLPEELGLQHFEGHSAANADGGGGVATGELLLLTSGFLVVNLSRLLVLDELLLLLLLLRLLLLLLRRRHGSDWCDHVLAVRHRHLHHDGHGGARRGGAVRGRAVSADRDEHRLL